MLSKPKCLNDRVHVNQQYNTVVVATARAGWLELIEPWNDGGKCFAINLWPETKNDGGECVAINLWPETKVHFVFPAGQQSKAHQWLHL